jgi:hypothetical protein
MCNNKFKIRCFNVIKLSDTMTMNWGTLGMLENGHI